MGSDDLDFALNGLANVVPHLLDICKALDNQSSVLASPIQAADFQMYFSALDAAEVYSSLIRLYLALEIKNRIKGNHIEGLLDLLASSSRSQSDAVRTELVDNIVKDLTKLEIDVSLF